MVREINFLPITSQHLELHTSFGTLDPTSDLPAPHTTLRAMSYSPRVLVSEPFVNQVEVIEKTLIEVQSQPSSYYGRRNNRAAYGGYGAVQGQLAQQQQPPQQQQYYSKYNHYALQQPQQQQYPQGSQPVDHYGGYRGGAGVNAARRGTVGASMGGSKHGSVSSGSVSSESVPMPMMSVPLVSSAPAYAPQVFSDDKVYGGFNDTAKPNLARFDPFGGEAAEYRGSAFLQQPLFNSSSSILGSNFTSTSSNIWGDTNKANDAAVWG